MAASGGGSGGNSGSIRAGKAFVELASKDVGLSSGLAKAKALIAAFGSATAKGFIAAAAGTTALGAGLAVLGKAAGERATDFDRLSKRVGVPIDQLSAFAYAAGTTGQEISDLEGHFENFAERVYQASQGTGEAAQTFARLGINAAELIKLNPAEQMIAVADAMKGITNDTARRGILSALGSDQFQGLNDLFKQGGDGIRRLMEQGKSVGAVLDPQETADQAAAMKELNRAWAAGKNAAMSLGAAVMPTAENARKFADVVLELIGMTKRYVSAATEFVSSTLNIKSAFGDLGTEIDNALNKGDATTAVRLFTNEVEGAFTGMAAKLASDLSLPARVFIESWEEAASRVKMAMAAIVVSAQAMREALSPKAAAQAANIFGVGFQILGKNGVPGGQEIGDLLNAPNKAIGGNAPGANLLDIMKKAEADLLARVGNIGVEKENNIRLGNAMFDVIRADLNRRLAELANERRELSKRASPLEKLPAPRVVGEAIQKQVSFVSSVARGQFGSGLAQQAFGGGSGIAEKQLDAAKQAVKVLKNVDKRLIDVRNEIKELDVGIRVT